MLAMSRTDISKQKRLLEIIKSQSFQKGQERSLASGSTSDYYFDMKPTTLHPEGASLIADLVYELVSRENAEYIGGLASGAIPIISEVCARSWHDRPIRGFYVREEAKPHGLMKLIEGYLEDGSDVIILDDVTTKGGSVMKAVAAVRERRCRITKILSVVDREEGARERFQREGLEFVSLFTTVDFV